MGLVEKRYFKIPLEELKGIDEIFFRQIQMDGDKVLKKFKNLFEETKEVVYSRFTSEGICKSFEIKDIKDDTVLLEGGEHLDGKMTARVFAKSQEAVICAVTIHGYHELEDSSGDFMREFFYDGWGTAFAEAAFAWLKDQIKEELLKKGVYSTCSWSPGQHNVNIHLQRPVFRMIGPEAIGITLNDTCMMYPKKSTSGFFGIGTEADIEHIRACDFCERRQTCPSAYATAK